MVLAVFMGLVLSLSAGTGHAQSVTPAKTDPAQAGFDSMKALVGKAVSEMLTTSSRSGDDRLSTWLKTRTFKGFRLASCRPPSHTAPNITEPPRSEPAVSLCRP
jgi:hypothetical protein